MNRRALLATTGVSIASGLSGCMSGLTDSDEPSDDSGDDTRSDSTDDGEDEPEFEFNNELVEDGKALYKPFFAIRDFIEITPESFTVDAMLSTNPVDSTYIHAHETIRSLDNPGEWDLTPIPYVGYTFRPEDNQIIVSTADDMQSGDPNNHRRVELQFETVGDKVSTLELPNKLISEADIWDEMRTEGDRVYPSYVLTFELEKEPPMFEPFVYTFSWEDENTHAEGDSGPLEIQTPQLMRVGEDKFVFPDLMSRTNEDHPEHEPRWRPHNEYGYYDHESAFHYERAEEGNTVYVGRVSSYGWYSSKYDELNEEFIEREWGGHLSHPTLSWDYLDATLQNPWAIEFEIPEDEYIYWRENRYGPTNEEIVEALDDEGYMEHEFVDEISTKLADVCEMIGATEPTEQIRVIADFIQYFDHTWDVNPAEGQMPDVPSISPGTSHPLETLRRGYGDCRDYTILGAAILQHEVFDFDISIAWYSADEVDAFAPEVDTGHVSVGVAMDNLEIDTVYDEEYDDDRYFHITYEDDGRKYVYLELSSPQRFGMMYHRFDWPDTPSPLHEAL